MHRKDARQYTNDVLPHLIWALGLNRWQIEVEWKRRNNGQLAYVQVDFDYQRADIEIDAAQLRDERHLLHTLRHECLHILHGSFCELLGHDRR